MLLLLRLLEHLLEELKLGCCEGCEGEESKEIGEDIEHHAESTRKYGVSLFYIRVGALEAVSTS